MTLALILIIALTQPNHDIQTNKYGYCQYFNLSIYTSTYTLPTIERVPVLRSKYLWNIEDTSTSSTWILYDKKSSKRH